MPTPKVRAAATAPPRAEADVLMVPLFELDPERWRLRAGAAQIDAALEGALTAALRSGDFRGKEGESLTLYPDGAIAARRVVLLGAGPEAKLDPDALRRLAGRAVGTAGSRRAATLALLAPTSRRLRAPASARALAEGAVLAAYRFDAYREQPEDAPPPLREVTLLYDRAPEARSARSAVAAGVAVAESQNLARDLSNEPGNALPPAALARAAQRVARQVGLHCRVLGPADLTRRKMGGILAVGGGSAHPPRLIVLEHNRPARGRRSRRPTVALVGKGVTFDSGGISIKPAGGMGDMKHDMSGAAAVVGALRACAVLDLPLHVVGVIGAAENMPGPEAYRPGDVVRTASGKTIEIVNTDAEGRVVLADALHFARTEFEPAAMVDLATLTGACVIALGPWCSGLFAGDEALAERIRRAGEAAAEPVWALPVWEEHRKHMKSRVADIKNAAGREASSSTAAAFLSHFAGDTPWAHLDIAGTAWTDKTGPYQPAAGATGVGVRLLVELLESWRRKA